ncbi:MAG: YggT family protein [Armatimonadetes bacterium]|nr:YggT family protein [Armatimonadota bacterium]
MFAADFGLVQVIRLVFWLYFLLILARCVLSWFRTPSYTSRWLPLWNLVYGATEPALAPIRRGLSRFTAGVPIDLSPFVLILLLSIAEQIIIRLIVGMR